MSKFQSAAKERRLLDHPLSPGGFTYALLDTNALIPARLSDILFDCAGQQLFFPRWTRAIEQEFINNWADVSLKANKGQRRARKAANLPLPAEHVAGAKRRLSCFRAAVGIEWEVVGYDDLDILDRVPRNVDAADVPHVAACLVMLESFFEDTCTSKVFLISNNLKDLSVNECAALGIEVITPGEFLDRLMIAAPSRMLAALNKSVTDLNGFTESDLLNVLKIHKAHKAARSFRKSIS